MSRKQYKVVSKNQAKQLTSSNKVMATTDDIFGKSEQAMPMFMGLIGCLILLVLFVGLENSPARVGVSLVEIFSSFYQVWPLTLSGLAVFLFGYSSYRKYMITTKKTKLIDISDTGILIGRMTKSDEKSLKPIGLNEIRTQSFRPGTSSGISLTSSRRNRSKTVWINWTDILCIFLEGSKDSDFSNVYIKTVQGDIYSIEKENAFWWIKEETFFSHARAHCSNIFVENEKVGVRDSSPTPKYTNLWLENFSKPEKRIKYGELVKDTELNNGQYKVLSKLGAGGQGSAYLAEQSFNQEGLSTNLEVVLKEYILPNNRGQQVEEAKSNSLRNEADILGKIDHEQIVSLLDCFVEDHRGYLVLEYIAGASMRELVKEKGSQPEDKVIDWSIQICDILNYLHNLYPPIIHRDLTPDNLILEDSGKVKLFDFTVARQFESSRSATVVGKQSYIPPEQFCGKACPASDIYSLGCTMFYFLTGNDPEPMEVSNPAIVKDDLSEALGSIVVKATSLDLSSRYPSSLHMKADLFKLI